MPQLIQLPALSKIEVDRLLKAAQDMRLNAYAPYSKFMVGTAVLTVDGRVFAGCNVESADYDGTHAEESALAVMVAAGTRSPRAYATIGGHEGTIPSLASACGKCRQKFMEFASLSNIDPVIIMPAGSRSGVRQALLSELLPHSFGPAYLFSDLTKYRR